MIPDLAWWGRLLGLLATEAALIVALAVVAARLSRAAQWRRLIWQTAFLAVALVWCLELGGGRDWLARWRPVPAPARQVTARVIGEPTVHAEPVPFEFPTAMPVADLPPTPPQPLWWPGAFWLAGFGALWLKALGSRLWLAWRIRVVHKSEVGQAASLPIRAPSGRLAACPTPNEAPPAEVAATVARLRTVLGVGPVRLVAWRWLRGPVAFGLFRPTVAVPADFATRFTPVQREAMLAHELAHLANRDPLWLLVAELVCALAWWHPLMWWARRQFRAACEAAADEASALVPGGRVALAEALVNFGRELTAPGGVGVAGSGLKSELARRVKALLAGAPGWKRASAASGWLVRGGAVGVALAWMLAPNALAVARAPLADLAGALASTEPPASGRPLPGGARLLFHRLVEQPVGSLLEPGPAALTNSPRLAANVAYEQPAGLGLGRASGSYREPSVGTNQALILSQLASPEETVAEAESRHEAAQFALNSQAKPSQLATRQFRLAAKEFTAHLQSFLPPGETNAQALQLAVRTFCATNGVEFLAMITNAPGATPPLDQPAIFYNDRTGQLFVRATLENLEHIEHAIQRLNLPSPSPKEADQPTREAVLNDLKQREALLAGLRARLPDDHPEVLIARADISGLRHQLAVMQQGGSGTVERIAVTRAELLAHLQALGITHTELLSRYRERHPRVAEVAWKEAALQAKLQTLPQVTNAVVTARFGNFEPAPPLFTRQFRVDPDKFAARVLAGFDPAEEAARRTETLPNRSLIASDIGASGSPRTLVRAVSQPSQFGFAGGGEGAEPNLLEAALAYFRRQGVEFAPPVANMAAPDALSSESRALFYNPDAAILSVRASLEDLAKVERALDGLERGPRLGDPTGTERAALEQNLLHLERESESVSSQLDEVRRQIAAGAGNGADLEKKERRLIEQEAETRARLYDSRRRLDQVAQSEPRAPQVQLAVFFLEMAERGADDLGLDWLFGQPPTNNPAPVTQLLTNLPGSSAALQGDRLRVDRLEVAGQSAVLTGEQFGALRQRLEGRSGVDFLSAPQVISLSDRQAQVSVGDVRTLVTGVVATDGSTTNDADIRYVTDQVSVGPVVDLYPRAEGDAWRVRVVASLNEFLGYDAPGKNNRVEARAPGKRPLRRDVPLPRLRKRETQAEALAQPGEIIALRGPLAENVIQTKDKVPVLGDVPLLGRLFRRESTQTRRTRLYVFVQPTTVDARGNVVGPAAAK